MRLFDYHSHTSRCHHATGQIEEYARQAQALGFSDFGMSDHSPWMIQNPDEPLAMRWDEIPGYVAEVQELKQKLNRGGAEPFRLHLGMEMDFVPHRTHEAREVIEGYPWDYLIGSVHHVGLWSINEPAELHLFDRYGVENSCEAYFGLIGQLVRERFGDIVGHLDLPKKLGTVIDGGCLRWIEPLIPMLRAAEMAVEINTSGFDCATGEMFPSWEAIEALAAGGVMLTLGSDSHAPGQVGRHFDKIIAGLRERGVTRLYKFEKREPIAVDFSEMNDETEAATRS